MQDLNPISASFSIVFEAISATSVGVNLFQVHHPYSLQIWSIKAGVGLELLRPTVLLGSMVYDGLVCFCLGFSSPCRSSFGYLSSTMMGGSCSMGLFLVPLSCTMGRVRNG